MDRKEDSPDVGLFIAGCVLTFIVFGDIACAVGFLSGNPEIALGFPGLFFTAVGILAIVRWANRRSDPRHAKRPPDAP